ncbi:MAG: PTS IIA-like nitrogen regulatory protein PtsN [Proteobacteria bacterium]|nr:PTS IIA-like nitrogen regulatory protein PtsN [Pseudomonadota bacterium]
MQITDLLAPQRIACHARSASKKRTFELLSELLAGAQPGPDAHEIFDSLAARERLGGTGLGHGVALPHGRLKGAQRPMGAFVQLADGVDFDALDKQPADLLFALLVPEHCTEEHLQILALLAQMFSDKNLRAELRAADSSEALYELLSHWRPAA